MTNWILSCNVNGLNAWVNKESTKDFVQKLPDGTILCLQEVKATPEVAKSLLAQLGLHMITCNHNKAKAGYAGVCIAIKEQGGYVWNDGDFFNIEGENVDILTDYYNTGRICTCKLPDFTLVNVYVTNSGDKDDERKAFDTAFSAYLKELHEQTKVIVVGDFNVVADVKSCWCGSDIDPESPGCKPYEIANFHEMKKATNLVDLFRHIEPEAPRKTWYHYRDARWGNVHWWGIDYALVSESLLPRLNMSHLPHEFIRFSDHQPFIIVYETQDF